MTSRLSTIAAHPARAAIELGLARGSTLRDLAAKFGVSIWALQRHKSRLPPQLRRALLGRALKADADLEKFRVEESENLLGHIAAQRARLLLAQDLAFEAGNVAVVAALGAQLNHNLNLVAKLLADFAEHDAAVNLNVLLTPGYLQLRSALITSLQPHPEAMAAVVAALHQVEAPQAEAPPSPVLEALPHAAQVAAVGRTGAEVEPEATHRAPSIPVSPVRLMPPRPISVLPTSDGQRIFPDADGGFTVPAETASGLVLLGWRFV